MKHTTRKALKSAYVDFKRFPHKSLYQCYNNPSTEKQRAYERCVRLAVAYDCTAYSVTSYNTFQFTFCFIGKEPETNREIFVRVTANSTEFIYTDEI